MIPGSRCRIRCCPTSTKPRSRGSRSNTPAAWAWTGPAARPHLPVRHDGGHLLGYVLRDDSSSEGEDAFFLTGCRIFAAQVGVEAGFDAQLRGHAGEEAVLVNNLGYRQTENVWSQPEPGENVVLTIDLDIQQAAERSLLTHQGADARAAIVVMDVHTGDVLAMVSSPAINPGLSRQ